MSSINIVGASCLDLLIKNTDEKSFFSGSYKSERIITSFGGDALNEALVLAHFGNDVKLCTLLGNDPAGRMIRNKLDEENIRYDSDILHNDIDTYVSLVFIDDRGERKFVGSENGSLRLLDLDHIYIDDEAKIVSFASLFISKMLNDDKLCMFFSRLRKCGKILCADCSTPKNNEDVKDMKCLAYLDYFFCNESEAKKLCHNDDLMLCEARLYEAGIRNVIIKCGSKGCLYQDRYYPPVHTVNCIDSTGAGDSFVAGFIQGLSRGYDIKECIEIANSYGSKACAYIGATAWLQHLSN